MQQNRGAKLSALSSLDIVADFFLPCASSYTLLLPHSSPPSLATLPLELTRRILFWLQAIDTNPVFEYSHWDYSPSLGNLALVNRQFAELSHAVLYEVRRSSPVTASS